MFVLSSSRQSHCVNFGPLFKKLIFAISGSQKGQKICYRYFILIQGVSECDSQERLIKQKHFKSERIQQRPLHLVIRSELPIKFPTLCFKVKYFQNCA